MSTMTKRIFRATLLVGVAVLIASLTLVMGALYSYFGRVQESQLRDELSLAVVGVEQNGMDYLKQLRSDQYRITWLCADGAVLYDTQAAAESMEHHAQRQEVQQALATGEGESSRYSDTLLQKTVYYAKRLPDGTVLRLSAIRVTTGVLVLNMLQPILLVLAAALILSGVLASRLARRITEPLNRLDLEHPLENDTYEELAPLLRRMEHQRRQIDRQMDELRRRSEEFEQITGSMNEGLVLLDEAGVILSINPAARRLLDAAEPGETISVPAQVELPTVTAEELEKELRAAGVTVRAHPWLAGCFEVSATGDLERLPAFTEGHFTVQDAAARLVATVAAPGETDRVLDMCAAPGGKSFALAIDQKDRGEILSCDVHPHKLSLIERGAERLGIHSVRTALADGRERHAAWENAADLVVADVPCSGLGIIRKKPDIRYKDPKELAELPAIQSAILDNAAAYVRPGGVLVYSTCTVLPEENEGVTTAFLDTHPDFEMEPFSLPQPIGSCCGQLTLWPQRYGTDGFYICRMRKK